MKVAVRVAIKVTLPFDCVEFGRSGDTSYSYIRLRQAVENLGTLDNQYMIPLRIHRY